MYGSWNFYPSAIWPESIKKQSLLHKETYSELFMV